MKTFRKVAATVQEVGGLYKRQLIIKKFQTEDGRLHEFTTFGLDEARSGAVIAITPDNMVVTTYQFRAGSESWLYELPGGGFRDGEDMQAAATRELREETGYTPGAIMYLGRQLRDAYINSKWHYFLATNCTSVASGRELDKEEHDQGAEVQLITIDELITNAKQGQMTDAVAVLMAYDQLMELKEGKS